MKIEVWSDYVCPFCYIGKRKLEEALKETGMESNAEIVFKAFELDPHSPATSEESMYEVLSKKYGMSVDEAKKMTENVAEQAKAVGLNYDFDNMKPANTFNAHRLAKLAEQEGVAKEVIEQLLYAYFVETEKIGSTEVLLTIAEKAGMDRDRVKEVLNSEEFEDEVRNDISEAAQIGVRGVPFFVINRKYAISGAQPTETFINALRKVESEQ